MEKGTIAKWLKKEGDAIAPGDTIAEVETDKVSSSAAYPGTWITRALRHAHSTTRLVAGSAFAA